MSWRVLADFLIRPRDWPSLIHAPIAQQVVAPGGTQGYSRYFRWGVDRGKTSSGMGFVSVNSGASRVQIRATRVLRFILQPNPAFVWSELRDGPTSESKYAGV